MTFCRYSWWVRYGLAVLAVALSALCRGIFYAYFGDTLPYVFFYPAVIFAAALLGSGPGFLAVALSALAADYWIEPVGSLAIASLDQMVGMLVFVMNNSLIVCAFEGLRRAGFRMTEAKVARARSEGLAQRTEDLRRAKEEAEEANRAKDRFLAILSHELRTPLTPALLVVRDRETDETLGAAVRDDMAMARRNLELEARLIDDLLDLNRLVHGKVELHLVPGGDLHQTLRNVARICRSEMAVKGLVLQMELQAPNFRLKADAGRLQQVFWNLLKNATKFTPVGGMITVRTSNPRPDLLRAEVMDTGCGINPQTIPRLFVAFEQGEEGGARQRGGLGLGLAICKAVVELHGGRISARSEGPGKGAVFTVDLPVCHEVLRHESGRPSAGGVGQWQPEIDGRRLNILLVEDHADTLRILSRSLRRTGCGVVTASSIQTALAAAQKVRDTGGKIDLLVSDLGLPDGDGRELMRELRALDGIAGIAVSGYGMEEDIEKSRAAGFAAHLTKPVQMEDIQAAISRLLPDLLHRT